MQIEIFNIPVFADHSQIEEVNSFLRSHNIIDIEKQLTSSGNTALWTIFIRYTQGEASNNLDKKSKIDYREILDEETFEKFAVLRNCRKEIAEKNGVPVYAVFTNEELAIIARLPEITMSIITKIDGIGLKKTEKYGEAIISMFNKQNP